MRMKQLGTEKTKTMRYEIIQEQLQNELNRYKFSPLLSPLMCDKHIDSCMFFIYNGDR